MMSKEEVNQMIMIVAERVLLMRFSLKPPPSCKVFNLLINCIQLLRLYATQLNETSRKYNCKKNDNVKATMKPPNYKKTNYEAFSLFFLYLNF